MSHLTASHHKAASPSLWDRTEPEIDSIGEFGLRTSSRPVSVSLLLASEVHRVATLVCAQDEEDETY